MKSIYRFLTLLALFTLSGCVQFVALAHRTSEDANIKDSSEVEVCVEGFSSCMGKVSGTKNRKIDFELCKQKYDKCVGAEVTIEKTGGSE